MTTKYGLFIDGNYVDPAGGEWLDTVNPYSGEAWAKIPRGGAQDVAKAVGAAKRAMATGPWAKMSASERGRLMRNIGDLVTKHAQRLAEVEVRDNGKLLAEVNGGLKGIAATWYYFAGLADKIQGHSIPIEKPDTLAFTTREPIGVVAALTAWNAPLGFVAGKCAPAMAAGCAVVVKPSEFASASTLEPLASSSSSSRFPACRPVTAIVAVSPVFSEKR